MQHPYNLFTGKRGMRRDSRVTPQCRWARSDFLSRTQTKCVKSQREAVWPKEETESGETSRLQCHVRLCLPHKRWKGLSSYDQQVKTARRGQAARPIQRHNCEATVESRAKQDIRRNSSLQVFPKLTELFILPSPVHITSPPSPG